MVCLSPLLPPPPSSLLCPTEILKPWLAWLFLLKINAFIGLTFPSIIKCEDLVQINALFYFTIEFRRNLRCFVRSFN